MEPTSEVRTGERWSKWRNFFRGLPTWKRRLMSLMTQRAWGGLGVQCPAWWMTNEQGAPPGAKPNGPWTCVHHGKASCAEVGRWSAFLVENSAQSQWVPRGMCPTTFWRICERRGRGPQGRGLSVVLRMLWGLFSSARTPRGINKVFGGENQSPDSLTGGRG